jgi:hypothetical protein
VRQRRHNTPPQEDDWLEAFTTCLQHADSRPRTVAGYRDDLTRLWRWFQHTKGPQGRLEVLHASDLLHYRHHLLHVEPLQPATIHRRLQARRWYLNTREAPPPTAALLTSTLGTPMTILARLQVAGEDIAQEDLARISPLAYAHVIPHGTYHFERPLAVVTGARVKFRRHRARDSCSPNDWRHVGISNALQGYRIGLTPILCMENGHAGRRRQHLPLRDLPMYPSRHSPGGTHNGPERHEMSMKPAISRRTFLQKTTVATGALIIGFHLPALRKGAQAAVLGAEPVMLNAFLRIGGDGVTTVIVNKSEMGQGIYTALPMILAEELDADRSKVRFEAASFLRGAGG